MGLCSSSTTREAHSILNKAAQDDYVAAAPIFQVLQINKKVARTFLALFEAVCDRGVGSLVHLRQALRVNKNDNFFFEKTFLYFQQDAKKNPTFTCPQFCLMLWWFLSLSHQGLTAWKFRVYFGGDDCAHHVFATQEQVFHMVSFLSFSSLSLFDVSCLTTLLFGTSLIVVSLSLSLFAAGCTIWNLKSLRLSSRI